MEQPVNARVKIPDDITLRMFLFLPWFLFKELVDIYVNLLNEATKDSNSIVIQSSLFQSEF